VNSPSGALEVRQRSAVETPIFLQKRRNCDALPPVFAAACRARRRADQGRAKAWKYSASNGAGIRKLWTCPRAGWRSAALGQAATNLPTNYTDDDFLFITLRCLGHRTISNLVNPTRTSRAHHRTMFQMRRNTMGTSLSHGSAKIYEFPAGGRAALGGRRYGEVKATLDRVNTYANTASCSESWYHQAAIDEERREWER
jgi:hypothetical protein